MIITSISAVAERLNVIDIIGATFRYGENVISRKLQSKNIKFFFYSSAANTNISIPFLQVFPLSRCVRPTIAAYARDSIMNFGQAFIGIDCVSFARGDILHCVTLFPMYLIPKTITRKNLLSVF